MVPPPVLKQILIGLANVLPKHKLVPQKDLAEAAFRDVRKRNMVINMIHSFKSISFTETNVLVFFFLKFCRHSTMSSVTAANRVYGPLWKCSERLRRLSNSWKR